LFVSTSEKSYRQLASFFVSSDPSGARLSRDVFPTRRVNSLFFSIIHSYSWIDTGSSYAPSDLLASLLLAQLEAGRIITARRGFIWHLYRNALTGWARAQGVELPVVPRGCVPAYHIFALLMPSPEAATGESFRFLACARCALDRGSSL
jgi:dTDP-4-amino-4,6-dideoxygalactose transaminase